MTDEMRVALVAVAMAAGLRDYDSAEALVDELAADGTADHRSLARQAAERATTKAWGTLADS